MITKQHKEIKFVFKVWSKLVKRVYNYTIDYIQKEYDIFVLMNTTLENIDNTNYMFKRKYLDYFWIRDNIIKPNFKNDIKEWSLPNTSLEKAVENAINACKNISGLEFRKDNSLTYTLAFDGRSIKDGYIYPSNFKRIIRDKKLYQKYLDKETAKKKINETIDRIYEKNKLKLSKELSKNNSTITLVYKRQSDKYYWNIPVEKEKPKNNNNRKDFVSLDPGTNPYFGFYDNENTGGVIGENWFRNSVLKIQDRLDYMHGKVNKMGKNIKGRLFFLRSRLKRAMGRCREKIKNIVKNAQWQLSNYFTKTYESIIISRASTKNMVQNNSSLSKSVKRAILTGSHYKFREKLYHKAEERGNNILLCREPYTSKTCNNCGYVDDDLGLKKKYNCPTCGMKEHRDINGAKNIFLRLLMLGAFK